MTTTWSIPHELGSSGSELAARDSSGTPTVRSTHARAKPPAAAVAADRNVRRGRTSIGLLREWLVCPTLTLPVTVPPHVGSCRVNPRAFVGPQQDAATNWPFFPSPPGPSMFGL